MAYGANIAEMHRTLSASLVDRILKGAKQANLPVAQPIKFDLLINLKTVKSLGLAITAVTPSAGGPGDRVKREGHGLTPG